MKKFIYLLVILLFPNWLAASDFEKYRLEYANNFSSGDFRSAIQSCAKALEEAKIEFGNKSPAYLQTEYELAKLYMFYEDYLSAEPLLSSLLAATNQDKDIKKYEIVVDYSNLLLRTQRAVEATKPLLAAIKEKETNSAFDEQYVALAKLYAQALTETNQSEAAEEFLNKVITRSTIGASNQSFTTAAADLLCHYYMQTGRANQAIPMQTRARNLIGDDHGKKSEEYANATMLLAKLYFAASYYSLSLDYAKEALDLYADKYGEKNVKYAMILIEYSDIAVFSGKLQGLDKLIAQVGDIIQSSYGNQHFYFGRYLASKAMVETAFGRYDEAKSDIQSSIAIFEKYDLTAQTDLFKAYNIYFDLLIIQKTYTLAVEICGKAELLAEKLYGRQSLEYSAIMDKKAALYQMNGEYQSALQFEVNAVKALPEQGYASSDNQKYRLIYMNNTAQIHFSAKQYDQAAAIFEDICPKAKLVFGRFHSDYAMIMRNSSMANCALGKYEVAYKAIKESNYALLANMEKVFPYLSETEKVKFKNMISGNHDLFVTLAEKMQIKEKTELTDDVFNFLRDTRGIIFSSNTQLRRQIAGTRDSALKADFSRWLELKKVIAKAISNEGGIDKNIINLDSINLIANNLEKNISEKSSNFKTALDFKKLSLGSLQSKLANDECSVITIRYKDLSDCQTAAYTYAFLFIDKSQSKFVINSSGRKLETSGIQNYYTSLRAKADFGVFKLFWKDIYPLMKDYSKIYFMPDGIYTKINPETFIGTDKKYLLEKHDFVQTSTIADIFNSRYSILPKNIDLFGYPSFYSEGIEHSKSNELLKQDLTGTKYEIAEIEKLFRDAGKNTSIYLLDRADDALLRDLQSPSVLHIATHGFFLEEKQEQTGRLSSPNVMTNPLFRSGLLLAGAGNTIESKGYLGKGIFTAYDAANMNLDNTNLVTLSACRTGEGEVMSGEGIWGLRKSFINAGAGNVVMSLWNANDQTTKELMLEFYKQYLDSGDVGKSLKIAKLKIMKEYEIPYYWGCFINE